MKIRTLSAIGVAVILTGCSSAPITLNYAPSSTMSVEGEVKVGDFKYLPGENNKNIKPNQIRNTAMGSILLEKNVDEYFETALLLNLDLLVSMSKSPKINLQERSLNF